MSKKVQPLDTLQALLQGEAIAIHTYDTFIPEIKEAEVKTIFQDIRSGHRHHLDQLSRRIEEMGSRPRIKPGLGMKVAELIMDTRTMVGIAPAKMVRWALKGEDMGLTAAQEISSGNLDEVSRELVSDILMDSSEYVNQLCELIPDK